MLPTLHDAAFLHFGRSAMSPFSNESFDKESCTVTIDTHPQNVSCVNPLPPPRIYTKVEHSHLTTLLEPCPTLISLIVWCFFFLTVQSVRQCSWQRRKCGWKKNCIMWFFLSIPHAGFCSKSHLLMEMSFELNVDFETKKINGVSCIYIYFFQLWSSFETLHVCYGLLTKNINWLKETSWQIWRKITILLQEWLSTPCF